MDLEPEIRERKTKQEKCMQRRLLITVERASQAFVCRLELERLFHFMLT
jgi:hypothetical protein